MERNGVMLRKMVHVAGPDAGRRRAGDRGDVPERVRRRAPRARPRRLAAREGRRPRGPRVPPRLRRARREPGHPPPRRRP